MSHQDSLSLEGRGLGWGRAPAERDRPRDHYTPIKGCREYPDGTAGGVDGIEVVDDATLPTEPYTPFLVSTAVTGILRRAKYQTIAIKAMSQHPLSRALAGTGAFIYVDWKDGSLRPQGQPQVLPAPHTIPLPSRVTA